MFASEFTLTNYSGTQFEVAVNREVRLLGAAAAWRKLGVKPSADVSLVAYETDNKITNAGKQAWKKDTGLLSIWILGMFTPSPSATIVVPIKAGPESELGVKVTSDYFGQVPPDRLVVKDDVIYFCADGKYRSKIGINPKRSKGVSGSYDADNKVLTIVQYNRARRRHRLRQLALEAPGQPLRRRRGQLLQRRPAHARRQANGPVLRAGILLPGRRAGAGQEPLAHPPHHPSERAGIRLGRRRPRHAGRVHRGHQERAQEPVKLRRHRIAPIATASPPRTAERRRDTIRPAQA